MFKKFFFTLLLSVVSSHASYYTSIDSDLTSDKIIIFKDENKILFKPFKEAKILGEKDNLTLCNFKYLLENNLKDKEFMLKIPTGFLKVKTNISQNTYKIVKAYDNNYKKMSIQDDEILEKVLEYEREKRKRPIKVNKFDFSKEKLYLTYVSNDKLSLKRMNMTYEMKKKNTKVVIKAPISLLDPEYKGSEISEHVGIFRDINDALYEMKKVNIVNGSIELSWINHPKKKVVQVQYITDGRKDKKILSKVRGQQFYSFEGTMYLASWMDENHKDKLVFTFMNGSLPFDVTMLKISSNVYELQKKGQTIYIFNLDENHFVSKVSYPAYKLEIMLEDRQNDTTRKNKIFLDDFLRVNKIKFVKE